MSPSIVQASNAHLEEMDEHPRGAGRALAAVLQGRTIGICGYFQMHGQLVFYARISPELRAWPKTILRGAKRALAQALRIRAPIVAYADPAVPSSRRTLEHLGFRHLEGETYWRTTWQ